MANEGQSQQPDTSNGPAGGDSDGFDDAFDQRSNGDTTTEADGQKEDAPGEDGKAPSDGPNADGPSSGDGQEAAPPVGQQFNPYEGLTPAQAEHFRKLEQSERSQRGRVGALTTKINRLSAAPVPQQTQQPNSESSEGQRSLNDLMAEVAKAAEEYPDAVGPLKEAVELIGQQVSQISQQIQPMTEREQHQALESAYTSLAADHPDYAEIGQDPKFHEWHSSQSDGIKALAGSMDPKEVSLALTMFKAETGRLSAAPPQGDPAVDEANARRERQLDGARDVSSRGAPVTSGTPNDFDAAFNSRVNRFKA